ncbi:PH domain-containing protein [Spirillospora albida]|uniref:PH domain-containing protein n=1 Tax=Spirillospora albida TaxID=58123 RepID=UPI0004BEC5D1|nr:PH domain-containing protein [Spirillospora albida]
MALRDKLHANAAPHLRPGEKIEAAFCAQSVNPYWILVSYLILVFANSYRVVVVTNQRILVCRSGRMTMTPVKEVLRELPRSTRIGQPKGLWWSTDALGEKLYIHKRFHKDVAAADGSAA